MLLQRLQGEDQALRQKAENLRQQDAALQVASLCGYDMPGNWISAYACVGGARHNQAKVSLYTAFKRWILPSLLLCACSGNAAAV